MNDTQEEEMRRLKMDVKQKRLPKLSVRTIDHELLDAVKNKKEPFSPAPARLQRSLTKPPSGRWNCLCSPTTHVGSFRCRIHRNPGMLRGGSIGSNLSELAAKSSSHPVSPLAVD